MIINPSDSVVLLTNIWYLHHSHYTYSYSHPLLPRITALFTLIFYSHQLLLYFTHIGYSHASLVSVILL